MDLSLGTDISATYLTKNTAFTQVYWKTCTLAGATLQDTSGAIAPAFITKSATEIDIKGTTNADYPADSLAQRPTVTKDYLLTSKVTGSTDAS